MELRLVFKRAGTGTYDAAKYYKSVVAISVLLLAANDGLSSESQLRKRNLPTKRQAQFHLRETNPEGSVHPCAGAQTFVETASLAYLSHAVHPCFQNDHNQHNYNHSNLFSD